MMSKERMEEGESRKKICVPFVKRRRAPVDDIHESQQTYPSRNAQIHEEVYHDEGIEVLMED
jgi:hypothetical protein